MFFSRSLDKVELRYRPSELEVACIVWVVKRLRTMIYLFNLTVKVLIDYLVTKDIVA